MKTRCYQEGVGQFEPTFQGEGVVPGEFLQNYRLEKSQNTDFNEDKTNECASVACIESRTAVKAGHSGKMKKHALRPLR